MKELLYGTGSLLLVGTLCALMVLACEAGYRLGRACQTRANAATREHVNAIQASMLGILALLLGFTFSLALQRFDSRSEALVDEVNAIGTAYLRAQLLPQAVRSEAQALLHRYVELRAQASAISLDHEAQRQALQARSNAVLDALWRCARQAAALDPGPVGSGLFIQALNEAIDANGRRDAELSRHVPEQILLLLYASFVVCAGVLGYSSGIAGHRPAPVTYILVLLIVVLAFVIVDLDRPRRGLIRVDPSSLIQLKSAIDAAQSGAAPQAPRPAVTGRP